MPACPLYLPPPSWHGLCLEQVIHIEMALKQDLGRPDLAALLRSIQVRCVHGQLVGGFVAAAVHKGGTTDGQGSIVRGVQGWLG